MSLLPVILYQVKQKEKRKSHREAAGFAVTPERLCTRRWQFSHRWSCHTEQPCHQVATRRFFPDRVKWDLWNVSTSSSYLVRLQSASCREVTHCCLASVCKWKKLTALRWQFYSLKKKNLAAVLTFNTTDILFLFPNEYCQIRCQFFHRCWSCLNHNAPPLGTNSLLLNQYQESRVVCAVIIGATSCNFITLVELNGVLGS